VNISVSCPTAVSQNPTVLNVIGPSVSMRGGLLSFSIDDAQPLALIRKWDEELGLAIADSSDAALIRALSHLKAVVLDVERAARRESSYRDTRESSVAKATSDAVISHSHAEQNTSNADSSEQHGVAPQNEEIVNEQTTEERAAAQQ
jgi:hypothetical protein